MVTVHACHNICRNVPSCLLVGGNLCKGHHRSKKAEAGSGRDESAKTASINAAPRSPIHYTLETDENAGDRANRHVSQLICRLQLRSFVYLFC
jgi:hypothetical protein